MSTIAENLTRIQNAKSNLKTSINAKTDAEHQITNETIDEYSSFVDSITTGGGGGGSTGQPLILGTSSYGSGTSTTCKITNSTMKSTGQFWRTKKTMKAIVFVFVRDSYTLSSNLTLLAETDYFSYAGANQKLLVLLADLNSTDDYVVTINSSSRWGNVVLYINNSSTPVVTVNHTTNGVIYNCPVNTDFNIYGVSHTVAGEVAFSNYTFPYIKNFERIAIAISNDDTAKTIGNSSEDMGIIGLKVTFENN